MAIIGLTDRGLRLPFIGTVRKGAAKQEGKAPRDLDHFRVEISEDEPGLATRFLDVYGRTPREINFILLFDDISKSWDAFLEAYTGDGRMVARSDNRTILYAELQGGRKIINGVDQTTNEQVPLSELGMKLKPTGRLNMVIPELGRGAYLLFKTTSWADCAAISDQLEAIKETMGGTIKGVPLVLKRRQGYINTNVQGKRRRVKKWLVTVEVDEQVAQKRINALMNMANENAGHIEVPDGIDDDVEDIIVDDVEELADMVDDIVITDAAAPVEMQSFEQEHGRSPVAGEDYDPDGPFSEEDYAYLSGESTETIVIVPDQTEAIVDKLEGKTGQEKLSDGAVEAVVNSQGVKYIELDNTKLSNMTIGLGKAIAKLKEKGVYNLSEDEIDQLDGYLYKMAAIWTIMLGRKEGKWKV